MDAVWESIAARIAQATGECVGELRVRSVGGGCINDSRIATAESGREFFVKLNTAAGLDMFEAECAALAGIAESGTIRVPRPVVAGVEGATAFLVCQCL